MGDRHCPLQRAWGEFIYLYFLRKTGNRLPEQCPPSKKLLFTKFPQFMPPLWIFDILRIGAKAYPTLPQPPKVSLAGSKAFKSYENFLFFEIQTISEKIFETSQNFTKNANFFSLPRPQPTNQCWLQPESCLATTQKL